MAVLGLAEFALDWGGGLAPTIRLGFCLRHKSDLVQVVRVMTPRKTISSLKLTKFIIKLQDTCPFISPRKLHYLNGVRKIITNVVRSGELAGKQKAMKNASVGYYPLRKRDTLEPRTLLPI